MGIEFASKSKQLAQPKSSPLLKRTAISPAPQPVLPLQGMMSNQGLLPVLEPRRIQRKCACGGSCPQCQQTKLKLSQPNDTYEREAERVADQVMRMPEPQVERQREGKGAGSARSATAGIESTSIQDGSGQDLPDYVRSYFEARFGHDFSNVRIHDDSRAADIADSIDARAFTVGRRVFFSRAQFQPRSDYGRRLLAHELAHVVQQDVARSPTVSASKPRPRVETRAAGPVIQRQVHERHHSGGLNGLDEQAHRLFEAGMRRYEAGDYAGARSEWHTALGLAGPERRPVLRYNIALTHLREGDPKRVEELSFELMTHDRRPDLAERLQEFRTNGFPASAASGDLGSMSATSLTADEQAHRLFEAGMRRYEADDYAGARSDWHTALGLAGPERRPALLYNIALTHLREGNVARMDELAAELVRDGCPDLARRLEELRVQGFRGSDQLVDEAAAAPVEEPGAAPLAGRR